MASTVTLQKLKKLIGNAYESGYRGALDLRDIYVEETVSDLLTNPDEPPSPNEGWRIYKVVELRSLPGGTMLEHYSLGKCWVETTVEDRCMKFANGDTIHFYSDDRPWNEPMRLIGSSTTRKPPKKNNPFGLGYNMGGGQQL